MWPTLLALRALGDSGTVQEINEKASEIAGFNDDQLAVLHNDGPQSEIHYRMAWARSYLKDSGAVTNSSRGIWSLSDLGRTATEDMIPTLRAKAREVGRQRRASKISRTEPGTDTTQDSSSRELTEVEEEENWKSRLLSVLQSMHPSSFEKLCQRVLRESGFTQVEVTGRSGDGGIDGVGVLRIALLSFQVFFQCKRYRGNVGSSSIRDFRGAMVGRTDKGLFITTGNFTPEAKREATRDGAPALDLIDGDALCDLLKEHRLGVQTEMVEQVSIDSAWFAGI
jgi:restriction system protein